MNNLMHVSANTFDRINKSDHTYKIWEELSQDYDNYYLFARSTNNRFKRLNDGKINVILIPKIITPSRIFIFSSFLIFMYIKRLGITHLLCQSAIFGGSACILAKKIYKVPVMIEIHGEEYFRLMNSKKSHFKLISNFLIWIFKSANKVRSLNPVMTCKLKQLGISRNVVEIYNRVNLDLFDRIKSDYKIYGEKVKIISVGRFVKEKNYENLIELLSEVKFNFQLTLVGGGELKNHYIRQIKNLGLENHINLIDWVEQKELIDLIVNNDIYIQSSISEGMPRAILEAMALQMPIISTNVGSIEGVLKKYVNGILVNQIEFEMAEAIEKLVESIELRAELGKNARLDVIKNYEWHTVFKKYKNEIFSMK